MPQNDVWDVNHGVFSSLFHFLYLILTSGQGKRKPPGFSRPWEWHKKVHSVSMSRGGGERESWKGWLS